MHLRGTTLIENLEAQRNRFLEWLTGHAYPLWSVTGVDRVRGGFVEALDATGAPLSLPRRARVQPRQVFAFAQAASLGWHGDVETLVRLGIDYILTRYRRPDGLYRTLVADDGRPLDDRAVLYDQAFVLLGFASAANALDAVAEFEPLAVALLERIDRAWRMASGAFRSGESHSDAVEANPHMHLLEACLTWSRVGSNPGWRQWTDSLADLALDRFIDSTTGALHEIFTADLRPATDSAQRSIEPGHQYEWAWLLLQCPGRAAERCRAALRLIDIAELHGVRRGVAVNSLGDDLCTRDGNARLWSQTERLRAADHAARTTGERRYELIAAEAAAAIFRYLETAKVGLWFDVCDPNGTLIPGPIFASTFYHLVGAIAALNPGKTEASRR